MLLVRGLILLGLLCTINCTEQQIVTNGDGVLREKRGFDVGFLVRNLLLNSAQVSNAKYPPPRAPPPPPPPPRTTTEAPTTTAPTTMAPPPPPPPPPPPRRAYPGKFGLWHGYDYFDYYDAPAERTQPIPPPPPPPTTTTAAPTTMPPPPPRTPEYFGLFGKKFGPWWGSDFPTPRPTEAPTTKSPPTMPPTMPPTQPPAPPTTRRPKPRPRPKPVLVQAPVPVHGPHFFATPAPLPHFVNPHYGQQQFGDYGVGPIHFPNYYSDYDYNYHQAYLPPQPQAPPPRKRPAAPPAPPSPPSPSPPPPPPTPPSPPPTPAPAPEPRRPPFHLRQKLAFLYAQPDDTSSDDAGSTANAASADDASSTSNTSNDTNPDDSNDTDDGADAPNTAASAPGSDAGFVSSSYSNAPNGAYLFNNPSTGGGAAYLHPTQFGAQYF